MKLFSTPSSRSRHPEAKGRTSLRIVLCITLTGLFALLVNAYSAIPDWWATRGVLDPQQVQDQNAAVNVGQLKSMAARAMAEMDEKFPGGAGPAIHALVQDWRDHKSEHDQSSALNIGQLKAVAKLFYDRLVEAGARPANAGYPWSNNPPVNENNALVNAGQLKNVFSFPIPYVKDTDSDGLPDVLEALLGYNLNAADTDGNGIEDGDEDFDQDGLTNRQEILTGLNPQLTDSDSNGIPDGLEDSDGDGLDNKLEFRMAYSPRLKDSNGNGISDGDEDADGDALQNVTEVQMSYLPYQADSDNDGIPDGTEDFDSDTLTNLFELRNGYSMMLGDSNGDGVSDNNDDPDSDGLSNYLESQTDGVVGYSAYNIRFADSNGNGIRDGDEDYDGDGRANLTELNGGTSMFAYEAAVVYSIKTIHAFENNDTEYVYNSGITPNSYASGYPLGLDYYANVLETGEIGSDGSEHDPFNIEGRFYAYYILDNTPSAPGELQGESVRSVRFKVQKNIPGIQTVSMLQEVLVPSVDLSNVPSYAVDTLAGSGTPQFEKLVQFTLTEDEPVQEYTLPIEVNKVRRLRPMPFGIDGYKRGTIKNPGPKVFKGSDEYGQETVLMENADSEDNTTQPDYSTEAINASTDDDMVKVVLHCPKDMKINGGKLALKHTGMEVDPTKTDEADKYKETGPSRLNFYKPDGTKLTDADLKIDDLENPGNGYLAQILTTGELTLFVEGAEKFGMVGMSPKSAKAAVKLGGAILNFEVTQNNSTNRARLLIYRGGFLLYRQPKAQPGSYGTFEFRDGKGRITDTQTDSGNVLLSWTAKSGKSNGANYDVRGGLGHIPPGWRIIYERTDFTPTQRDKIEGSGNTKVIRQGSYVRWRQDDEVNPENRYTTNYVYDASKSKDSRIGEPDAIRFKFQTEVISPSSAANRSHIQIHPDGIHDGTAGCIGIQTYQDCEAVAATLRNYHALKLKVEIQ